MTQTTLLKKAEEKKSPRGRSNGRVIAAAALVIFVALFSVVNTLAFLKSHTSPILNLFAPAMKYVLDYDANAPASENVTVPASQESWYTGKFTVSSDTPEREGYTFLGWKRDKNGAGSYVPGGSSYTADTKHTVLYAQWKENTHTYALVFHANGGENVLFGGEKKGAAYTEASAPVRLAEASHTFAAGTLAASAEREEYTFLGWAETATEETPAYKLNAGGQIAQAITVLCDDGAGCTDKTHEKHLYAVWIESGNIFKLHYHENAGSVAVTGMPDPSTEIFNDPAKRWHEFVVTGEEPVRADGLYFHSWNTEPDGNGESYSDGKVFYMEFEDDEETTVKEAHLYAQWRTPNSYKLTYDANAGGAAVTGMPDPLTREAKSAHRSYTFTLESGIPVRTDGEWIFAGWNTKADGSGTHHGAGAMFTETLEDGATSAEATLYAQWLAGNYVLIYDSNGGTGEPETAHAVDPASSHTFTVAAAPSIENGHLVFMGWADTPDATAPVYAYNGLDYNGEADPSLAATLTLTEAERVKTVYAVWGFRYEISYDHNAAIGGTGPVPPTESYVTAEKSHTFMIPEQTAENTPTRPEYYWGWWGNSPTHYRPVGSHQYSEPITFYASEPVRTLYAFYQPPKVLHLAYNKNTTDTVTNMPTETGGSYTELVVKIQIPGNVPTRGSGSNYVFSGWSEDPNAAEGEIKPGDYYYLNMVIANRRTLYAIWQPTHTYSISFNANTPSDVNGRYAYIYYKNAGATYDDIASWPNTSSSSSGSGYNYSATRYYSSGRQPVTVESWTWDQAFWDANGLYARIPDGIASYANYKFLGWAKTRDADTPDYPVVDGILQGSITVNETNAECSGATHSLTLYAVWERTPIHYYSISFNANNPSDVDVRKAYIHYKNAGATYDDIASWPYSSASSSTYDGRTYYYVATRSYSSGRQPVTVGSWTWDQAFWDANGLYARIPDGSTSTANYKFLGWAKTRNAETPDYPVVDGILQGSVTLNETNAECSGTYHTLYLYAVWERIPFHYYSISFNANNPSDVDVRKAYIHYKNAGATYDDIASWPYSSASSSTYNGRTYYYVATRSYSSGKQPVTVGSWTWDQAFWDANGLYARIPDGSTSNANYKFLGWAKTPNAETPDYYVVDGILQGSITVSEPNAECSGTYHTLYLYAVWERIPFHYYSVSFNANNPSDVDVRKAYIHYKNAGATYDDIASWPYSSASSSTYDGRTYYYVATRSYSSGKQPVTVGSWTWDQAFWDANGLYARIPDGSATYANYKFLGWAKTPDADTPDYSVVDGILQGSITLNETNAECDGTYHTLTLYAVWERTPLHTYSIYFNANNPSDVDVRKAYIHYKSAGATYADIASWPYSSASSSTYNGKTTYYVATRGYSSGKQPVTVGSWTWDQAFWDANGVYARIPDGSATYANYKFLGWAKTRDADTPDYSVVDGILQGSITLNETNAECDGTYHTLTLYAVWERTPLHTYSISFNANNPSDVDVRNAYIHYKSAGATYADIASWPYSSASSSTYNGKTTYYVATRGYSSGKQPVTVGSWTWDQAFWNANGLYARIPDGSGSQYDYEFLGWAKTRDADTPDYPVVDGILQGSVTVSETDAECDGATHTLYLYAVWRKCRVYTLRYTNGSNLPETQTHKMYPDDPNWDVGHTFTVSTVKPTKQKFAFVGWSTETTTVFGEFGYLDDVNSALHDLTEHLQSTITLTPSNFRTTLYAVWMYEYRFDYSATGGEGAPPTEYLYYSSNTCHFDVDPDVKPERAGYRFLGWAQTQNATAPECSPYTDDGLPMGITVTAKSDGYTPIQLYAVWEQIS